MKKRGNENFNLILETILTMSPHFLDILNDIRGSNEIAHGLYRAIYYSNNLTTNYNALGISDTNDEISFIPDSQYKRYIDSNIDPWEKTKSKSKIGRLIRQLIKDNVGFFGKEYSDKEIEEFVNLYKTTWDKRFSPEKRKIRVVNGKDILYWYDQKTYLGEGGTLGNSCMRYSEKNHYMSIYGENPDIISLIILTENEKLIARSLLWKLDDGRIYLDRVYIKNDSDYRYIYDWVFNNVAKSNDDKFLSYLYKSSNTKLELKSTLKNTQYKEYPYADSFIYLYKKTDSKGSIIEGGFVSNKYDDDVENYVIFSMQETSGGIVVLSHVYSEPLDIYIRKKDAVFVSGKGYYHKDDAVIDYDGNYILKSDSVFSESLKIWVLKENAINHPKFGLVDKTAVVEAISGYKFDEDPTTIVLKLKSGDKSGVEFEELLKNDVTFANIDELPYGYNKFKQDILIQVSYYVYPKFLCYRLYRTDVSSVNYEHKFSKIIEPYYRNNHLYITKLDSEFFGIKIEEDNYLDRYFTSYISEFSYESYYSYLENRDNFNDSDKFRNHIESIHKYKMEKNIKYKNYCLFAEYMRSNKIDASEFLLDIIKQSTNKLITNNKSGYDTFIRLFKTHHIDNTSKELSKVKELVDLYLLYYVMSGSMSDASYNFNQDSNGEYRKYIPLISDISYSFKYTVYDDIEESYIKIPELKSMSGSYYIEFLRKAININSIKKYLNTFNFLEK